MLLHLLLIISRFTSSQKHLIMKTLILISLLFCSTIFFANNPKTPPLKISQYNYFDFMDKFALDDTSVVIIDFFLRTHNEKTIGEMSESPLNSTVQATTSGPSPVVNQLPVHKKISTPQIQ